MTQEMSQSNIQTFAKLIYKSLLLDHELGKFLMA